MVQGRGGGAIELSVTGGTLGGFGIESATQICLGTTDDFTRVIAVVPADVYARLDARMLDGDRLPDAGGPCGGKGKVVRETSLWVSVDDEDPTEPIDPTSSSSGATSSSTDPTETGSSGPASAEEASSSSTSSGTATETPSDSGATTGSSSTTSDASGATTSETSTTEGV